jgi:hypothetical protein
LSDFSRSPLELLLANQQKGYVGVHIEQGVPVLDRDLNLLQDLVAATVRSVIARYIGNGIPAGVDGFAIQALPAPQGSQDFHIAAGDSGPGACLVGGIEVSIPAVITYSSQVGVPALTTPSDTQPDPRTDIVYLDIFLTEVDGTVDTDLTNSQDVGIQTSVRLKPDWVVRVGEGVPVPDAPPGHEFYPLAQLRRPRNQDLIDTAMITDLRQRRLTVADMEQRLSLLEKVLLLPAFASPPLPQFVPESGVINQPITLNGTNFNVGSIEVRLGDVPAKVLGAPSATQIVVRVPPGLTPGDTPVPVKFTVYTAGGSVVSDDTFTVQPAPAFADPGSQFSPVSGIPGTQVTLNGFNFNIGVPQVQFGSVDATLIGTPTANQIVAQVPDGTAPPGDDIADVKITVTTSKGSAVSDDTFRAASSIPPPSFASPPFTQKEGVGGQTIQLNGQGFRFGPVSVTFDGSEAHVVGVTPTQILVQVPFGLAPLHIARNVRITVTTMGGSVTSDVPFRVTG